MVRVLYTPATLCLHRAAGESTGDRQDRTREQRRAAAISGAAHADREHVIDLLKAAFVQGRLTKDELDARPGQALTARTYAELPALTADIRRRAARSSAAAPARPAAETAPSGAKCGHRVG